ncbi:MAG: 4Fe-4S dicluster domain-containing protein [Clostridiales bacterium]|nr:4Fe-4S dicluster domain-containing protein [Candidatus Blautia equi]
MNNVVSISCTGCRYCSDRCPVDMPIPVFLSLYSDFLQGTPEEKDAAIAEYKRMARVETSASDCIRCGQCEDFCREHIPIMSFLQDITEDMEGI